MYVRSLYAFVHHTPLHGHWSGGSYNWFCGKWSFSLTKFFCKYALPLKDMLQMSSPSQSSVANEMSVSKFCCLRSVVNPCVEVSLSHPTSCSLNSPSSIVSGFSNTSVIQKCINQKQYLSVGLGAIRPASKPLFLKQLICTYRLPYDNVDPLKVWLTLTLLWCPCTLFICWHCYITLSESENQQICSVGGCSKCFLRQKRGSRVSGLETLDHLDIHGLEHVEFVVQCSQAL